MTYIEREALLAKAYWKGEHATHDNPYVDGCDVVNVFDIEAAPAADVAPVKHSKWEIIEDDYGNELMRCLECKSEFYDGDNDTVDALHNYCPNCGAKMDLED